MTLPTVALTLQIQSVTKKQIDTLNTVMDIYRLTSVYKCDVCESDKLLDNTEKTLTTEDKALIEGVVAAECRGDTIDGMLAVCQTIKDRGDLWDMNYRDVVLADGQYADPYLGTINDKVKLAVELTFDYGFRISEEPITHFHSFGMDNEPYWAEAKICRGMLGSKAHHFYY